MLIIHFLFRNIIILLKRVLHWYTAGIKCLAGLKGNEIRDHHCSAYYGVKGLILLHYRYLYTFQVRKVKFLFRINSNIVTTIK